MVLMITALPYLLEAAWARALPGRDAATRNEALRAYQEFVEPAIDGDLTASS
jgi:hypothetical protein